MTYCVAVTTEKGLVFVSDSRTNAGVDNVSAYSKMHRFESSGRPEVRVVVGRQSRHYPGGVAAVE